MVFCSISDNCRYPNVCRYIWTFPIAEALIGKGVGLGTVLAFMMGVTTLSLPSIILLKTVVKPKLLAIFIAVVTVGILIIGYTFNIIGYLLI